jgi:hypothetical protein
MMANPSIIYRGVLAAMACIVLHAQPLFQPIDRRVRVDSRQLDDRAAAALSGPAGQPRDIEFNLSDSLTLTGAVTHTEKSTDGDTLIWRGNVRGTRFGQFSIAVTGNTVSANIRTDTDFFTLRPAAGGDGVITRQNLAALPPLAQPKPVPVPAFPMANQVIQRDDGALIDVMVVYSTAARVGAGGASAILNDIQLAVSDTNQTFANSGIVQRIRLVHTAEVNYAETGVFDTDLDRLQDSADGFIDNVHSLRNTYGADVVSLWLQTGDFCGIGYVMTTTAFSFANSAFNVVRRDCATSIHAFAHELGHNFGALHNREDNDITEPLFPYTFGYQQRYTTPYFRTVMAYSCTGSVVCPIVPYWSSPIAFYNGQPTGIADPASNSADNVRTLNNTRTIAANWRQAIGSIQGISPTGASFTRLAGTGSVIVTATTGYAWTAASNASWITVTSGSTYSGNATVNYAVAANSANSTRTGTILIGNQTFTVTQDGLGLAALTAPTPGSTFTSASVSFSWSAGAGVTNYWLDVGTSLGSGNISNGATTSLSRTVNFLPLDGRTIYVRLWSFQGSAWQPPIDYTFTACTACGADPRAALTAPAPGSTLTSRTVTFQWTAGSGAASYWLDIGNAAGIGDISNGATTSLSRQVSNLPNDGRTLYVRLWTFLNGAWQPGIDYTVRACTGCAADPRAILATPQVGATLSNTIVTFTWTAGVGATKYWLDVGNSVGSGDITNGETAGLSRQSAAIPNDGRTIFVRLWTFINGAWQAPFDYTVKACNGCVTDPRATISSPIAGNAFTASSATFSWRAGTGATNYWFDIGNSVGSGDISGSATTALTKQVTGLPADGRTLYVRLWTFINGAWQTPFDYTYKACTNCAADPRAVLTAPAPGSTLTTSTVTFVWSAGTGATNYWLDVGNFTGSGDISGAATTATSRTVANIPRDGRTIYVRLWTFINGAWQTPIDYTYRT